MRKFCTLELLSTQKISSFKSIRRQEVGFLIDSIQKAALDGIAVDLSSEVSSTSADITCRMVFGKKYADQDLDERGFKAVMQETMHLVATPNIGDYFPFIGALNLQGLNGRMKALSKVFDKFLEKIIDEHVQSKPTEQKQHKDFVDIMLALMESQEAEFRIDRAHVKAIMLDMLGASMDTSAAAIEWTLSELLKHPEVMKKVQNELEKVVGINGMVEESDMESLEYLDMVIKETLRLHPVAPLLIPHQAMDECVVNGFFIPKNSQVLINAFAIGRDQNAWTDADKFIPERFAGTNIDLRGHDFQLIPFGSGRRSCPGIQLGLIVVRLVVAQLMHCFHWKLPSDMLPSELDMTEEFGIVVSRANHLYALPSLRLHK
ncbi:Abieta-7,13-dien-18-ol hydroxylase [Bertholletia excelsa]